MSVSIARAFALAVSAFLAACTYTGGDIGDPLERKVAWFSYVASDDIRSHCQPGMPDRYRLVYNAVWGQQLRMYDLDSLRKLLVTRATRPGQISRFRLGDPLAPWQAEEARVQLDAKTYDHLVESFTQSGMFAPPPVGLDLPSRSYYWTAAFCKGGKYGFTAWKYPSDRFSAITFAGILFPADQTGVAAVPPGPVPFDPSWEAERKLDHVTDFMLTVGASGPVR